MSCALKQPLFQLLACFALNLMILLHAQDDDQSGFISIDCGLGKVSSYTENTTGIRYVSDANSFVATGESNSISPANEGTSIRPLWSLRSFPEGVRNCYKIDVASGSKYLIRVSFLYGNYDGQDRLPQFELHLGPNLWDSVTFEKASTLTSMELIYVSPRNYIHVCLVNIGYGVPFISSIELRPLLAGSYDPAESGPYSLSLVSRYDTGQEDLSASYRYPSDIHDRIWSPYYHENWTQLSTTSVISDDQKTYNLPSDVMRTAATTADSKYLNFSWLATDKSAKYYVYVHFAEVVQSQLPGQSRQLYVTTNADGQISSSPIVGRYLFADTTVNKQAFVGEAQYNFSILTTSVFFDPIVNAMEIYMVKELLELETSQEDVEAITEVKSTYNITKNWVGDPCSPPVYLWEGLKCRYQENESPRIISLDLSSSGLTGEITPAFSNLTMLQTLKLDKNNLTGSVPDGLIDRRKSRSLSLSLCENPNLSGQDSCKKKKKNIVLLVVLPILGTSISIFLVATAIWWGFFKSKGCFTGESFVSAERRTFTKSEIIRITNNFSCKIGEGGFGKVYQGTLDGKQVAVKTLLPSAPIESLKTFKTEAKILMNISLLGHKNIVSLIGYCGKAGGVALVYEFMPEGDLEQKLFPAGDHDGVLPWKKRLEIAIDIARGILYLHTHLEKPIVHRDLKPANILLTQNLEAKIGDFGIAKVFASEKNTHTTTTPMGTTGYFDPECYNGKLTPMSDVYSFGIVLLQLITGKELEWTEKQDGIEVSITIAEWVRRENENLPIQNIVDPKLQKYKIDSAQKAIATALNCSLKESSKRLKIDDAMKGLEECLRIETTETTATKDEATSPGI